MSWQAVARKDFHDAIRSRWLWVLSVLFVVVFAAPAVANLYFGQTTPGNQQTRGVVQLFIFLLKEGTAILVPLTAIVIAYGAISRERESGTVKLLLSLPHSRDDVVLGKVLGRSVVIAVPVLVGFLVSLLTLLPAASGLNFTTYVQFALLTALLGVVFVGISVGFSAAVETNQQAVLGAGGAFGVFWFAWNLFVNGIANAAQKLIGLGAPGRYKVVLFMKLLNPIQSYKTLVDSLFMPALDARIQMFGFLFFVDPKAQQALGQKLPLLFSDAAAFVYLLAWLVVPVAVGLVWFREKDL